LGTPTKIADGILRYDIKLKRDGRESRVWIYLPEKPASAKLPCVLIAPAGSHLFDGMSLGRGSEPEHLPYVRAGFVVVAYDLDGELRGRSNDAVVSAVTAFRQSKAGLVNQHEALDHALANVPQIDAANIFVAGHSSAATHALLVAANEPRVKGVVAYAPATEVADFIGKYVARIEGLVPGFTGFVAQNSPINLTARITVPVFVFQAKDDTTMEMKVTRKFIDRLKKTNRDVTFVEVGSGGHYASMIDPGIAKGIEWMKARITGAEARTK
jgi:dipeptidyl aminopeptidase/acylaminoacyl peptidase